MISQTLALTHATPIGRLFTDQNSVTVFEKNALLNEVFQHFIEYASDVVIIVENAIAVGILTIKDMIQTLENFDNLDRPVDEFMNTPLHVFDPNVSIADVLDTMNSVQFDKIVVGGKDGILGVMDKRHLLSMCYSQLAPLIKHEHNMIESLTGLAKENQENLFKMATTDILTEIGNRRLLEEVFQSHQKLEERFGVRLYLVIFDIDDFKNINDTFGHTVGDSVLKELTQLVSQSIRRSDIFIRWGGEEFVILFYYDDNPMTVMKIAEHLCETIDQHYFEKIIHATCSFGVTLVQNGEALLNVIDRADKALYRAKGDGKNCVRMEL